MSASAHYVKPQGSEAYQCAWGFDSSELLVLAQSRHLTPTHRTPKLVAHISLELNLLMNLYPILLLYSRNGIWNIRIIYFLQGERRNSLISSTASSEDMWTMHAFPRQRTRCIDVALVPMRPRCPLPDLEPNWTECVNRFTRRPPET